MNILVINPGVTSTKIAIYKDEQEVFKKNIEHNSDDIAAFDRIIDQKNWRQKIILSTLEENNYKIKDFDAICGRGGLMRHIPSGTYRVNENILQDVESAKYGEHASNLGPVLAYAIASTENIPSFIVDPVSTDEMEEVARVSGLKGMERQSFLHALNQKGMARKAAKQLCIPYEELNLIVVHMGGGVSVAAHKKGKIVDLYNVRDEGSFSLDRGGSLPTNNIIDLCFSGLSKKEVKKIVGSQAGVFSYLGTRDFREVEKRVNDGDKEAKLIYDALVYQHSKDIAAMAAVLKFDVDAIVLTGGMANSLKLCSEIKSYVGKIAKVLILPGEEEMKSLALGALRVLNGEKALEY